MDLFLGDPMSAPCASSSSAVSFIQLLFLLLHTYIYIYIYRQERRPMERTLKNTHI